MPGTDRTLHVVDTPGLFDTDRTLEEVKIEIAKTLLTFPHGVHAFIYVMNSTERFTEEEHNTLKEIKVSVKARSHRAKANRKAKKIKEQSEEIKRKKLKHQRKFLPLCSFSLGVNGPLQL